MSEKRYNGWTNYETWNVKLWIDNEHGSYTYWREAAQECYNEAKPVNEGVQWTKEEKAAYVLSERIKSEFESEAPELNGCYADLLNAALSEVNWHEIAVSMIGDCDKTEPSE